MTMPDKVYAGHNGYGTYWQTNASDTDTTYLRADIADELARALEEIAGMDLMSASAVAYNALTRYRALTP